MIELTLYNHLKTALSVPVFMEIPGNKNELDKYIVLSKIDAGLINHIKAATFSVEVYADSLYNAAALSEDVKNALFDAIELDDVTSVSLGSERLANDTQTKEYKYDIIINLYHY